MKKSSIFFYINTETFHHENLKSVYIIAAQRAARDNEAEANPLGSLEFSPQCLPALGQTPGASSLALMHKEHPDKLGKKMVLKT